MRKLDIEVNFEEIFNKKKKIAAQDSSELDELIADQKEEIKRRKRASGGVATLIIAVILIIISTTSFVVTSESPGTVSYQTNRLSSLQNLMDDKRTLGLIFSFERAFGRVQNTFLTFIDPEQNPYTVIPARCQLPPVSPSRGTDAKFSLDAGTFKTSYTTSQIQTYATVCRSMSPDTVRAFSIGAYGPVSPPLATYPPPGTLTDAPVVVQSREVSTRKTVPVVSFTWMWTEMVSTSVLDLLAPVTTKRRLQANASYKLSTRGVNDSFVYVDSHGGEKTYPWPTCDSFDGYEAALSFIISYTHDNPNNQSYVVSETSFVSWAFATLITLGSVIALKPTITKYLDKLSNYWRMKPWAQWVLFSLYTVLMPLPMSFVLFNFIANEERLEVRGATFAYQMFMTTLLIIMAALLMATWVGVLVRHVYTNIKRRKQEQIAEDNVVGLEPENATYEAI